MHTHFLPIPILFNVWKHHFYFVVGEMKSCIREGQTSLKPLYEAMLPIGNSLMDCYEGLLSPEDISEEILCILHKKGVLAINPYLDWLGKDGYQSLVLSDQSTWIVKMGHDQERYIHIHPARYSLYNFRIRSNTYKTAIAVCVLSHIYQKEQKSIEFINHVRQNFLRFPPIATLKKSPEIEEMIQKLSFLIEDKKA